ncbi:MAG: NosD domain-containing protein [Thermoplasmata archaeon]
MLISATIIPAVVRGTTGVDDKKITKNLGFQHKGLGLLEEEPKKEKIVTDVPGDILDDQGNKIRDVNNIQYLPPVGDQGSQNSCVGWSMGYYHNGYLQNKEYGWDKSIPEHQMSPAPVYNYINGGEDHGAYFTDAAENIINMGNPTMKDMPYNQNDYTSWPDTRSAFDGLEYRADDYHILFVGDDPGINLLKTHLASGNTAVLGIYIWDNFYNIEDYGNTYCVADQIGENHGGHGITVFGYDDNYATSDGIGAFRCVNSWGTNWGNEGFFWMSYKAVKNYDLSQRNAYYLDDKIGYKPSLVSTVRFEHDDRGDFMAYGIDIGLGNESSPYWTKRFMDYKKFYYGYKNIGVPELYQDPSFPSTKMVFDLTDGKKHLSVGSTQAYLGLNDSMGGGSGKITHFELHDFNNRTSDTSPSTPANIPDGTDSRTYVDLSLPSTYGDHTPIRINKNRDFYELKGVFSGNGSAGDPYVIDGLSIDGGGLAYCLFVGNTTADFEINNCHLYNATGVYNLPYIQNSGLALYNSSNGKIDNNNLSTDNIYGLRLQLTSDIDVSNNTIIHNTKGIFMNYSSNNVLYRNHVEDNNDYGICIDSSNYTSITNNTVINHEYDEGIWMMNSDNNNILYNNISHNNHGLLLYHCDNHLVSNNTICDNFMTGVAIYWASDMNTLCCNNISHNHQGVDVSESSYNNTISKCEMYHNYYGINFYDTENNTVVGNAISSKALNDSVCITSDDSNGNLIYDNSLSGVGNLSMDPDTNTWNSSYPIGGNYWSDYNGSDVYSGPDQDLPGSDGIGDTPYEIPGGDNVDHYPLLAPLEIGIELKIDLIAYPQSDGWNFISIPIILYANDIENILESVNGSYDKVMFYHSSVGEWKSYMPDRAEHYNDIDWLSPGMGFWIRMNNNDTFCVNGTLPRGLNTRIILTPGWNMVGYPSEEEGLASDVLPSEVSKIGVFNESREYNLEYVCELSTYTMVAGEGYWVYNGANEPVVWTVEY